MPIIKVSSGYKFGKTGKVFRIRSKAVKQGRAISISKARKAGHNIPKRNRVVEVKGSSKSRAHMRRL